MTHATCFTAISIYLSDTLQDILSIPDTIGIIETQLLPWTSVQDLIGK